MEAKGCSQPWRAFPEFKNSRSCWNRNPNNNKTKTDEGGPHKSVTLAATSRYLTDSQYVVRKPLFSAEQQTSILKKTNPPKHTQKEKHSGLSGTEHSDVDFLARSREELSRDSFSPSHRPLSPPSASTEDHYSLLGVSELMGRFDHEERSFGSRFSGSRSAQRIHSSPVLEVERLNPPLRPQLTSTVLYPTYVPCSRYSRAGQSQLRLGGLEGRGEGETKPSFHTGHSRVETMSPHQVNYWACAIPKASPPSPDRRSSDWDPNKEYQALLDYTYPLRPGKGMIAWDSSELREDSLLQTDPQDSGIELEHLGSSTNLSGLDFPECGTLKTRSRSPLVAAHRSPYLPEFTRSLDDLASTSPLSLKNLVGLSFDSLDNTTSKGGLYVYDSVGHSCRHRALTSSTSSAFIRSTSVLPRSRCVGGELDEEFRPLPEQLEELKLLSKQVREVMVQLSHTDRASWESLEPGTNTFPSLTSLPENQDKIKQPGGVNQDTVEGINDMGIEEESAAHIAGHRRTSAASVEPVEEGELTQANLREVELLIEQLRDLTLPSSQRSRQEDQEQSDSLMRHIQVFCLHLEQLIKQLYTVSERMELLSAPTVDINSVKSSLAEYESFQKELSSHHPLTASVLKTGQLLLSCINTTSPLLRNALLLIEKQSGALQTHTEHFLSSILSAMDSLTQPGQPTAAQSSREDDPHPVEVHDFTV